MSKKPYKQGQLSFLDKKYQRFLYQSLAFSAFVDRIKEGYHWSHNYESPDVATKKTFVSSQCLAYNVETIYNLNEYIDKMKKLNLPLPSLAYPMDTSRGGTKLKLIYVFNRPLIYSEFAMMHTNIASAIGVELDKYSGNLLGSALVNRNCGCPEYGMFVSGSIYTMNDFS